MCRTTRDQGLPAWLHGSSLLLALPDLFLDQVTRPVDEGEAVDVIYLHFVEAFDPVSHSILLEQLEAHGLDRWSLHWSLLPSHQGQGERERPQAASGEV